MFFELISMLFAIIPDYGNDYMTKENKNWTSFKIFALKLRKFKPQHIQNTLQQTWLEAWESFS